MPIFHSWDQIGSVEVIPHAFRKTIEGEQLKIGRVYYGPGSDTPEHTHFAEQIFIMVDGEVWFKVEDEEVIAKAGDVVVVPSNVPHACHSDSGGTYIVIVAKESVHAEPQSVPS